MDSLILLGAMTSLISSTGSVGLGDDIGFNGSGNYINETVFRMTSSAFEDEEYKWFSDYRQLNINQWFSIEELYIDSAENYFAINQELYVSTNNQDYELVGIASEVLISDMSISTINANMYVDLVMSVNTGDYFASCYDMIGKYFKIKTTFSYENIHTDTDLSWNTYKNSQKSSIAGLTISEYTASYEDALKTGYTNGYDAGVIQGEQTGYTNGYQNGYNEGMNDASTSSSGLSHLFVEVFNAPINWFSTIFDFDILGINIAGLFLGLISILLMGWLIRRFI